MVSISPLLKTVLLAFVLVDIIKQGNGYDLLENVEGNFIKFTTIPGSYESLWDLSPFIKEKRFKVKAECYGEKDPGEKLCLKVLIPGLTQFSAGAIPSFFPLSKKGSEEESSRCFKKLFDWGDCKLYERLKVNGPSTLGSALPVPPIQNWFQQENKPIKPVMARITPFHLRNFMTSEDINWASSLPIVYDLPFFEYERGEDALHVNLEKKLVDLDISPNVSPDPRAKREYERLPEEFNGHVKEYFRFISKYGTHMKSGGTLGARWTTLFSPVSYQLFNSLKINDRNGSSIAWAVIQASRIPQINFVVENGKQWKTRSKFRLQGGEFNENFREMEAQQHLNAWSGSILAKPSIISAKFLPVNDFLDSPASKRYNSFKEMIKCEEAHNSLRKIIFQFSSVITTELNYLARYLLKAIEKQTRLICPSEELQKLIEEGITAEKNIDLEKFTLELIKEPQFNYKNQKMQRKSYKLPLIPGICFNFSVKLRNIERVKMNFPKGVNCFSVYKSKGCKGEKIDVFNEEEMKNVIDFAGSLSFCPVCNKKQSLF